MVQKITVPVEWNYFVVPPDQASKEHVIQRVNEFFNFEPGENLWARASHSGILVWTELLGYKLAKKGQYVLYRWHGNRHFIEVHDELPKSRTAGEARLEFKLACAQRDISELRAIIDGLNERLSVKEETTLESMLGVLREVSDNELRTAVIEFISKF